MAYFYRWPMPAYVGNYENQRAVIAALLADGEKYIGGYSPNGSSHVAPASTWAPGFDITNLAGFVYDKADTSIVYHNNLAELYSALGLMYDNNLDYAAYFAEQAARAAESARLAAEYDARMAALAAQVNAENAAHIIAQQLARRHDSDMATGGAWFSAYRAASDAAFNNLPPHGETDLSHYREAVAIANAAGALVQWLDAHPPGVSDSILREIASTDYPTIRASVQAVRDDAARNAPGYRDMVLRYMPARAPDAAHSVRFGDWYVAPDSAEGVFVNSIAPSMAAMLASGQWNDGTAALYATQGKYAAALAQKYQAQYQAIVTVRERVRTGQSLNDKAVKLALVFWETYKFFGDTPLVLNMQNAILFHEALGFDIGGYATETLLQQLIADIPGAIQDSINNVTLGNDMERVVTSIGMQVAPQSLIPRNMARVKTYAQGSEYFILYPFSPRAEYINKVVNKSAHAGDYFTAIGVAMASLGFANAEMFFIKQATQAATKTLGLKPSPLLSGALAQGLDSVIDNMQYGDWFETYSNDLVPFDELTENLTLDNSATGMLQGAPMWEDFFSEPDLSVEWPDASTLDFSSGDYVALTDGFVYDTSGQAVAFDYSGDFVDYQIDPAELDTIDTGAQPDGGFSVTDDNGNTMYVSPSGDVLLQNADGSTEIVVPDDAGDVISFTDDEGNLFVSTAQTAMSLPADDGSGATITAVASEAGKILVSDSKTGDTFSLPASSSLVQGAKTAAQAATDAGADAVGSVAALLKAVIDGYVKIKTSTGSGALKPYTQTQGGFTTLPNGKVVRTTAGGKTLSIAGQSISSNTLLIGGAILVAAFLFSRKGA